MLIFIYQLCNVVYIYISENGIIGVFIVLYIRTHVLGNGILGTGTGYTFYPQTYMPGNR